MQLSSHWTSTRKDRETGNKGDEPCGLLHFSAQEGFQAQGQAGQCRQSPVDFLD